MSAAVGWSAGGSSDSKPVLPGGRLRGKGMDEQDKKDKQNQKRDTAAVQEELEQQLRTWEWA